MNRIKLFNPSSYIYPVYIKLYYNSDKLVRRELNIKLYISPFFDRLNQGSDFRSRNE